MALAGDPFAQAAASTGITPTLGGTLYQVVSPVSNGAATPNNSSFIPYAIPAGQMGNTTAGTDAQTVNPTSAGALSNLTNTGNSNMAAVGALPPNLGVTAGSAPGTGSLTQGTALPNITTTQAQATATPQFYTDYLNQLATQGAGAAQGAQYVGAQPLQTQAFQQVGQNVGNYQPALTNATNLASSVGGTSLADAIGNYGQANIAANLAPQATAGLVGSGQFGSSRGAQALGQTLSNADLGILAQQQTALQQDQANKIAAANSLGNLATTTQNLGLGDVNALSTLGAQQQTIGQNAQLFPMAQLTAESNLLKGATIPTATSSTYTGPIPGAYNTSPLAQIAGVGSVLAGTGLGQTLFGSPASTNGATAATPGLLGSSISSAADWIANGGSSTSNGGSGLPTGVSVAGTDPSTGMPTYVNSSGTPVDQFGNPATAAYTQQQADAQSAAQQQADAQAAAYAQQQADAQAALDAQNNGGD